MVASPSAPLDRLRAKLQQQQASPARINPSEVKPMLAQFYSREWGSLVDADRTDKGRRLKGKDVTAERINGKGFSLFQRLGWSDLAAAMAEVDLIAVTVKGQEFNSFYGHALRLWAGVPGFEAEYQRDYGTVPTVQMKHIKAALKELATAIKPYL